MPGQSPAPEPAADTPAVAPWGAARPAPRHGGGTALDRDLSAAVGAAASGRLSAGTAANRLLEQAVDGGRFNLDDYMRVLLGRAVAWTAAAARTLPPDSLDVLARHATDRAAGQPAGQPAGTLEPQLVADVAHWLGARVRGDSAPRPAGPAIEVNQAVICLLAEQVLAVSARTGAGVDDTITRLTS